MLAFLRLFFTHLYTTLAWGYDFVAWASSMGQWRDWVSVAAQNLPPGDLVELGPGPGHLLLQLAQRGRDAVGVERSRQMVRRAELRLRRGGFPARLIHAQAQELPLPSNRFGAVISTFPSEYIQDHRTLQETHRILKPGGEWIIVGIARITGRSLPDRIASWLYRITGQSGEPQTSWDDAFRSAGFETRLDRVQLARAEVMRLVATKRSQIQ